MSRGAAQLRVCIIGAGFGGLALALALTKDESVKVVILEALSGTNYGVAGDLNMPSGEAAMDQLRLSDAWDKLTAKSGRDNHVPQEAFQQYLRRCADDASPIRYGHRVIGVEQVADGALNVCCAIRGGIGIGKAVFGPFDIVVGADGALSQFRKLSFEPGRVALVGDARWAKDRWYDFGTLRIRCGADLALRDGVELGRLLLTSSGCGEFSFGDLGRFCAVKKRKEVQKRRFVSFLIVAMAVFIKHVFSTWSSMEEK